MRCHGSRIETLECLKRKLCIGCQVPGCLQDIRVVYTYVASDWFVSKKKSKFEITNSSCLSASTAGEVERAYCPRKSFLSFKDKFNYSENRPGQANTSQEEP